MYFVFFLRDNILIDRAQIGFQLENSIIFEEYICLHTFLSFIPVSLAKSLDIHADTFLFSFESDLKWSFRLQVGGVRPLSFIKYYQSTDFYPVIIIQLLIACFFLCKAYVFHLSMHMHSACVSPGTEGNAKCAQLEVLKDPKDHQWNIPYSCQNRVIIFPGRNLCRFLGKRFSTYISRA